MPTVALTRSIKAAGLYRTGSRTLPANVDHVTIAIDSDWTPAYDVMVFGIEASLDGGVTWNHVCSATTYGGWRDKFGNPPTLTLKNPVPGDYRLFILLSNGTDIGVTIDVVMAV